MSCPSVDPGQPPRETEIAPYVAPYVAPGDLARAIARIGELDCTRTLPGRLVWYEPDKTRVWVAWPEGHPLAVAPADPTRQGGLESWGRANGSEPLDVEAAIANGDSR